MTEWGWEAWLTVFAIYAGLGVITNRLVAVFTMDSGPDNLGPVALVLWPVVWVLVLLYFTAMLLVWFAASLWGWCRVAWDMAKAVKEMPNEFRDRS